MAGKKKAVAVSASSVSDIEMVMNQTIGMIEGRFGKGSIMSLGVDSSQRIDCDTVSSGSMGLDAALGIGGLPFGRIVEIYGPESSGKTTLTLHVLAEAQRRGMLCAFIDAEHALDMKYARALGVQTDRLLVSQPDNGEQALDIADALTRSGAVKLIIVDSVAALIPKAELEGDMGDSHVGLQARLMSQAMRKLSGIAHQTGTLVVFINQLRHKIGVKFGSPEVTTGGNALKYYASVRLDIRRIATIKDGTDRPIGSRTRVKVAKNKCAPPFAQAEFEIFYGRGIDRESEILDMGLASGVIDKSGSWFSWDGNRLGQGRGNAVERMRSTPEMTTKILEAIVQRGGLVALSGGDVEE